MTHLDYFAIISDESHNNLTHLLGLDHHAVNFISLCIDAMKTESEPMATMAFHRILGRISNSREHDEILMDVVIKRDDFGLDVEFKSIIGLFKHLQSVVDGSNSNQQLSLFSAISNSFSSRLLKSIEAGKCPDGLLRDYLFTPSALRLYIESLNMHGFDIK